MFILIVCFAMLVVGLYILHADGYYSDLAEFSSVALIFLGGAALLFGLLFIPIQRMSVHSFIAGVEASRQTKAVDVSDRLEGAAWRMYAAETNAELASARYYNKGVFDIWIPDEVERVKPIE